MKYSKHFVIVGGLFMLFSIVLSFFTETTRESPQNANESTLQDVPDTNNLFPQLGSEELRAKQIEQLNRMYDK